MQSYSVLFLDLQGVAVPVLSISFHFQQKKCRGGLVFWADTVGAPYIYSKLSKWAELYGPYFKPSSYLEQRAKSGVPLVSMLSTRKIV